MADRGLWMRARAVTIIIALCFLFVGCADRESGSGDLRSLLQAGQGEVQKGRYQQAIATFKKAISLDPNAPEPYMRMALVYEGCLDDPVTALLYYRKYEQLETNAASKEMVQGWIMELERVAVRGGGEREQRTSLRSDGDVNQADALPSQGAASARTSEPTRSFPLEQSPAYKDLEAKLASAVEEIRLLKLEKMSESALSRRLEEMEERVKVLEGEKESLRNELDEAAAQEQEYAARERQVNRLLGELREAERQRDLARADQVKAADEVARLKKAVNTYAATHASLQKTNDELRREIASLRSKPSDGSDRVRYYRVRDGDTLKKIAGYGSVYGDSNRWILIYQANKDKIRDPNKLTPGQVLVIPPR